MIQSATAQASPNIAFIKYWGNRDASLRLPQNGSISMNLAGLHAKTTVTFDPELQSDSFTLNQRPIHGPGLQRVSSFLDHIRSLSGSATRAAVTSENNFPTGAGIASSAAAFAALALAGTAAIGLNLTEAALSRLARLGSGSASRSIPGGFVEWQAGTGDEDSYAFSLAPAEHWPLVDCIAVVSSGHKPTGSTEGHALADTSPLQAARVADTPRRLDICRQAILDRDFTALAEIIEHDSSLMHAVMMTSRPPLFYWEPASLTLMKLIPQLRKDGLKAAFTLDAGANVHVICAPECADQVEQALRRVAGVQRVLRAVCGSGAFLVPPQA